MDELNKAAELYFNTFGEGYPMFSVPADWTDAEILADIKRAIADKKLREFPEDSEVVL